MTPTDTMVEAALDAWCSTPAWRESDHPELVRDDMRAALTAALAVSGYGEVVEALRKARQYRSWDQISKVDLDVIDAALSSLSPTIARDIVSQGN